MKMHVTKCSKASQRGFTTIVMMILLILMSILLLGNVRTIDQLGRELDLLDARQLQKYKQDAPPAP